MSGGERESRLGTAHVATLNILTFRNESTYAASCGVTRRFLRNPRDGESSNSAIVKGTREETRAIPSLSPPPSGLAVSLTGEASCRRIPPQGEESGARPASGASGRAPSANRRESAERPSEGLAPRNGSRAARGTEGTGLVKRCGAGAVAVGGAVYILHLRESTPRSEANHRERRLAGDSR